jgi:hypothetical protein
MSTENKILDLTFPAAEDLSSDQYKFVVLNSSGQVRRPDSASEVAIGILQNAPLSGEAAVVRVVGQSKYQANGVIGIGTFIGPEYVSATDAGKGRDNAGALAYARAVAVEATGAEDDLGSCLLLGMCPAITDAVQRVTTVTTDATAGANTWSAAELVGGLMLRDPAGDNRSDVTPTAAQIVGAVTAAIATSSFEFIIRNTADAAETITLTAGAGVTLSGTMTIAQNNSKRFLAVITDAGSGTEAVTIYSLGTFVH